LEQRLRKDVKAKIDQIGGLSEKDIDEQKQSLQDMRNVFTENEKLTSAERAERIYQSSRAKRTEALKPQFNQVLDELQGKDVSKSSTAKADKMLGKGKVSNKALDKLGKEAQLVTSLKAQKILGVDSSGKDLKKLTRLQRLAKSLGVDKVLSRARGGNLLSRPSATPNKKDQEGPSMGK
jgi:hypothetical protein